MWYNIDWVFFAFNEIPHFKRKPKLASFVQVLLKPSELLYYKWFQFRKDNLYKLEHTSQVCYLRKSLNDRFDPDLRRIYIGDGQEHETVYIYTEAEQQEVYIYTDDEEPTLWLRTEAETADTGLDFIVYVPGTIFNQQIHELNAHIKFYKAGGKRYSIFTINE